MWKKGYTHLYYGFGKGKTSILNGMVLRAYGYNLRIKYHRFLKNRDSGELNSLNKLGVEIASPYHSSTKFIWEMNEAERKIFKEEMRKGYFALLEDVASDKYDLIVADELLDCLVNEQITTQEVEDLLNKKSYHLELAISGHDVPENLVNKFDLASFVDKKRHYFDSYKQIARRGIEF